MQRLFLSLTLTLSLVLFAQHAQAATCSTHSYTMQGRTVVCTTCCLDNGHCNTLCH